MSSKKLFTSSAARRFITEECFSSFVSQKRLRSLQKLLCSTDDSKANSEAADALLCVTGIDSLYNEGCQELASYLLFGFFSERMRHIEAAGLEESVVEDVIILIKQQSVDVYCNPHNYPLLLPYIAPWRNIRLHCMNKEDYDGDEKSEAFKISSFIAMVHGCKNIAIPYSCVDRHFEFDMMAIEKWPIIQSHAITEAGEGTFFTMKYAVHDISKSIHSVYDEQDAVVFESLITDQLGNLETQWKAFLQTFEIKNIDLKKVTGKTLDEPVEGFFKHGRSAVQINQSKPERKPFVLIGTDTRKAKLEASMVTGTSSTIAVQSSGNIATHMICQILSPKSPLSCCRTYFFSGGNKCRLSENYEDLKSPVNDHVVLISIYKCCVEAIRETIAAYKDMQEPLQLQKIALQIVAEKWNAMQIPVGLSHLSKKENVSFALEAFDKYYKSIPLSALPTGTIKSMSITIYDIPSVESAGLNLGSVSFSESFIDSSITVQKVDGSTFADMEVLNLTCNVPDFVTWPFSMSEQLVTRQIKNISDNFHSHAPSSDDLECSSAELEHDLGECLVGGENAHAVVQDSDFKITGQLYIFDKAVVFSDQHIGHLCIPLKFIEKIEYYDGDSPSAVRLLLVTFDEKLSAFIPVPLRPLKGGTTIIAMDPKSKAATQFFNNVLPIWKEMEKPVFDRIEELPEEVNELHIKLQKEFDIHLNPSENASLLKKKMNSMPHLQTFLSHLEASTTNVKPIPSKHVNVVVGRDCDMGYFADPDQLIITILSGITGSHKENLCKTLTGLAKEDSRWAVLRPPPDQPLERFSPPQLQRTLTATWKAYRAKKSSKKMRALVVSPGFTDTVDIVQAILCHPDKVVASHLQIGAITVCIDPQNVYLRNHYALPKLFDQCAHGWVNNIVFTSCIKPANGDVHPDLDHIQNIIRSVNPNVALLLAEDGKVTRSTDIDLILSTDAFNADDLMRARYLSCPGWSIGLYNSGDPFPEMKEVYVKFNLPLDRNRFTSRLRRAKLNLRHFPFHGNIYMIRGRIMFEKDAHTYYVQHAVLSKEFILETCEPTQDGKFFLIFTGVEIDLAQLQHWLKQCFPFKPQKRVIRERSSLTKTEIARVQKKRHNDPLPEGWFYNGCQFVSLAGDRQMNHPLEEKFLQEYLQEENEKAQRFNTKIEDDNLANAFE